MNGFGRERQILGDLRGIQSVLDMDNKKLRVIYAELAYLQGDEEDMKAEDRVRVEKLMNESKEIRERVDRLTEEAEKLSRSA